MDSQKMEELLSGQISASKKVFGATPINEPWTAHQIAGELARLGIRTEIRKIEGCLHQLIDAGLVRERPTGEYMRVPVTYKEKVVKIKETPISPAEQPVPQMPTPMERVMALAQTLRKLADDAETVVLEFEEQLAVCSADSLKLKQLQALLKGM